MLQDDEIAFQFEKLIHPYFLTQRESYHENNYYALVSLLDKVPEIERMEMHIFLMNKFGRDKKVTSEVLNGVLTDENVVADVSACLQFRRNTTGFQAFKRVREAVIWPQKSTCDISKPRKCKRATFKCGLWYLRKSKIGFSYKRSKQRSWRNMKHRVTKNGMGKPFSRYLRQRLGAR